MVVKMKRTNAVVKKIHLCQESVPKSVDFLILSTTNALIYFQSVYALILGTRGKLKTHWEKMVATLLSAVDLTAVFLMLKQHNFFGSVLCRRNILRGLFHLLCTAL